MNSITFIPSRWQSFCAAGSRSDEIKHGHTGRTVRACSPLTCVFGHGGLIRVSLFLKDDVAELQHSRDHLQHTWRDNGTLGPAAGGGLSKSDADSQMISSWEKLMMCMASMVSWKFSLSCCPGMGMLPLDRKR